MIEIVYVVNTTLLFFSESLVFSLKETHFHPLKKILI